MTLQEVITYVDDVKPNAFPQAIKIRWINQLEGRLALEVFLMHPSDVEANYVYTSADLSTTLLVDSPHDDLYTWWLQAQIDLANGEYDRAQNTMAVFNNTWGEFVRWFAQRYDPAQGYPTEEGRTII